MSRCLMSQSAHSQSARFGGTTLQTALVIEDAIGVILTTAVCTPVTTSGIGTQDIL
ncbi:MAG: hypothetical protein JNM86_00970 [Phycisphaerae bacterium]|nr:hypothetical protein [Phycisphaerae bacterium]